MVRYRLRSPRQRLILSGSCKTHIGSSCCEEVKVINKIAEEIGRTVRAALGGWGPAVRLCVIALVAAAIYLALTHLQ